jgi:organic hydroperoxide reductase OsmC/OhrA
VATRAKRLEYGVELDRDWTARSDRGGAELPKQEGWSPEHLLLAGLVRCVLTSLGYHARRAGIDAASSGAASAVVTRRESDGRYGFVKVDVRLDVALADDPAREAVASLLESAERDCFVGASLTEPPHYAWTVNGEEIR